MRILILAIGTVLALVGCKVEEIGLGDGTITVRNEDDQLVEVLISDNDECVVGMSSSVDSSTTTTFSVGESSVLCIGGRGIPVEDGGTYVIKGGAAVPE